MFLRLILLFAFGVAMTRGADPAPPPDKGGKWTLSVDVAADGRKSISARLPADNKIPSGFDEVTPELVIRYRAGRAEAYVNFDAFLGSGKLPVIVAPSSEPAEKQNWRISADGRAATPPGTALAFVEQLKRSKTVSLQLTPNRKQNVTVTFTTYGVELVMKALISAGVKYSD